jgi:hypothetical protein
MSLVILISQPAFADEKEKPDYSDEPWATAGLYLGAFVADINSSLDLGFSGSGISVSVDGEDLLGLDEDLTVFRAEAFWRITRRSRLDFMYYDISRDGSTFLGFGIPDPDGSGDIPLGTRIDTTFDLAMFKASYAYSFFKNQHFDLALSGGLYAMNVDFKLKADGEGKIEDSEYIIPLPVLGLRGNFALTPKWFLRQNIDVFYLNIGEYTGRWIDLNVSLEYNFWKYAGVGLGYNFVSMDISKDSDDAFLSQIDMSYGGLLLYAKLYF